MNDTNPDNMVGLHIQQTDAKNAKVVDNDETLAIGTRRECLMYMKGFCHSKYHILGSDFSVNLLSSNGTILDTLLASDLATKL